jgi:uncharacterized integral membrane protein (TIGR00698 family)
VHRQAGIVIGKIVFAALLILACTGLVSPPLALAAGIGFAVIFEHPFAKQSSHGSRLLLQASVVALGFGINIGQVIRTGRASIGYTAISITLAMGLGLLLGKLFQVRSKAALLIAAGTAICGGSAIAAIAPITHPDDEELAMSMGTVFTLNSIALFLFPAVGLALHLTQSQFGLWSALAIHDTSSVVGAAAKYGAQALAIATVVKLTRALWIIPVVICIAVVKRSNTRVSIPWFIPLFCLAAVAKSYLPGCAGIFGRATQMGHIGLAVTLFLIGTGISARTVRQSGSRVMLQGVLLWVAVAVCSLVAIRSGWIQI